MSLLISKSVYSILSGNTDITAIIGTRLFPIVATHEDTPLPFIVYQRKAVKTTYSKDGHVSDTDTVVVTALSKDYGQSIDLIQEVRLSMEDRAGVFNGVTIVRTRIESAVEMCDGEVYVQELTFEIVTL